jgi:hypothetical protein
MMEAVHTSETSVYSNETKRRYIPEDSKLHIWTVFLERHLGVSMLRETYHRMLRSPDNINTDSQPM